MSNTTAGNTTARSSTGTDTAEETALNPNINDLDLRVPYYCEENAWRLARRLYDRNNQPSRWVVFLSNETKQVPMRHQRAAESEICCWDYHVILVEKIDDDRNNDKSSHFVVYDVDTTLQPYPIPLDTYLQESFFPEFAPLFRVIPVSMYLRYFSSDRSHMFSNGKWNAPPPTYACIPGSDPKRLPNTMQHYMDFMPNQKDELLPIPTEALGTMFTLEQFKKHCLFNLSNEQEQQPQQPQTL